MNKFNILLVSLAAILGVAARADVKITELPLGSAATSSITSVFPYVDTGVNTTKKLRLSDLVNVPALAAPSFCTAKPITGFVAGVGTVSASDTVLTALDKIVGNINAISAASVTVGTFDSQAASANGATIAVNTLYNQSASATVPGMVNTTTQTFAGQKTFSTGLTGTLTGHSSLDLAIASNLSDLNSASSARTNLGLGTAAVLNSGNLTDVGTDGITIGSGTNAILGSGTTISQHVADATHNGYLSSADWSTFSAGGGALTSWGTFGSTPNSAGASLSGGVGTLQPANATSPGGVSLSAQSLGAGDKYFAGNVGIGSTAPVSNLQINADLTSADPFANPTPVALGVNSTSTSTANVTEGTNAIRTQFAPSGNSLVTKHGLDNVAYVPDTNTFSIKSLFGTINETYVGGSGSATSIIGINNISRWNSTSTITTMLGEQMLAQNFTTGTVTTQTGLLASSNNQAGGTVTTMIGLDARAVGSNSAAGVIGTATVIKSLKNISTPQTVTTAYGLYLDSTGTATPTNNWGIFQNETGANNLLKGKLGIGAALATAGPVNNLHIDGGTSTASYLQATNNATSGITSADGTLYGIDTAANAVINNQEATAMIFSTSGTEAARILSGGNVGIGTSAPSVKLDVNGNARVRGLTTAGPVSTDSSGNLSSAATLGVTGGGTGAATLTNHGVLLGQGTSAIVATAVGATNTVLHGNTSADPSYSAIVNADITNSTIDLTTKVTGVLPSANVGGARTINAQTGTTYTFALADASNAGGYPLVTGSNASAETFTVPPQSSVVWLAGAQIDVCQIGAGKLTLAQGSGVTINSLSSSKAIGGQYVCVSLIRTASDVWLLIGNLIP